MPIGTSREPTFLERAIHLDNGAGAAVVLPGAGAYTAQALQALPFPTKQVSYWIEYTRGGVAGFPRFRAEWNNGTETAREMVLDESSLIVVQPDGRVNVIMEELNGPNPSTAAAITYVLTFNVPASTISARLLAREAGLIGTPGSVLITITAEGQA